MFGYLYFELVFLGAYFLHRARFLSLYEGLILDFRIYLEAIYRVIAYYLSILILI